jgi:hypothetical protein
VDAADAGDTVRICDGTFPENIVVNSNVILEGRGADTTILDGRENGSVVRVDGAGVHLTLRGLTLQHGTGTTIDAWYCPAVWDYSCGGAVEAYDAKSLDVEDCVVQENTADSGGGIFGPESGFTTISGTVIRDNSTLGYGGGAVLFEDGTGTLAISDSEVRDNSSLGYDGGGLLLATPDWNKQGAASIVDSVIDGNVGGSGGGIATQRIDLTLGSTTISNNTAGGGGGVYFSGSVVADDDTLITGNVADYGGGVAGLSTWYGGRIESNDAVSEGGGLYSTGDLMDVRSVAIVGNHSGGQAGGITLSNEDTLRDSSVTDNTADGDGGGLYVWGQDIDPAITDNCVVTGNVAGGHGGGAYVATLFDSIDTDWGEGKLDNAPDDVYLNFSDEDPVVYTEFAGGADFECSRRDGACE